MIIDSNFRVKIVKSVGESVQIDAVGRRIEIDVHGGRNWYGLRNSRKCPDHYVVDFESIESFNYPFGF